MDEEDLLPEQQTREKIDKQLQNQGWKDLDQKPGNTGYKTEYPAGKRYADYVLILNGEVVAVLEVKESKKNAHAALVQAENYAKEIDTPHTYGSRDQYKIPLVLTSNGRKIHLRDLREHAPNVDRELRNFHRPEGIQKLLNKNYKQAFQWLKDNTIDDTVPTLWDNQRGAIAGDEEHKGIEQAFREGKRKVLVQMATGTGKTWMAAAEVYRLLESELVNRVLFLADRTDLVDQAQRDFNNLDLKGSRKLKEIYDIKKIEDASSTDQIVVSTLQGMYSLLENHDEKDIPQDAFDLVITDEVHRSIYGEWKVVLSHFDSYQIGLTATPAEHTLAYFGGRDNWVYQYSYWDAVEDEKVVPYQTYRVRTGITMEGLTYEGKEYNPTEIEREITVPDRNKKIAEEIRENTEDGEKILVFAINDNHAIELEKQFREVYSNKDNDYVRKITYTTDNAGEELSNFKNAHMQPTIAITVEMISTGTDVEPLEHVVFARPVKSPILYNQMVGRGTRTYDPIDKEYFTIYDCVGVIDYFKEQNHPPFNKERTDRTKKKKEKTDEEEDDSDIVVADDVSDIVIESDYVFQTEHGKNLTPEEYQEAFEEFIENNKDGIEALKVLQNNPSNLKQSHLKELIDILGDQSERFTEDRLQKAYGQEMVDILGFAKYALGESEFPTVEDRVEKAFEVWEQQYDFSDSQQEWVDKMKGHFKQERTIKKEDFDYVPFLKMGGWKKATEVFGGEEELESMIEELNQQVILG